MTSFLKLCVSLVFILVSGCAEEYTTDAQREYFVKVIIKDAMAADNISDNLVMVTQFEMIDQHFSEQTIYFPIINNSEIYLGGLCGAVDEWRQRLEEKFLFSEISESNYDEAFELSRQSPRVIKRN